jgi:hypothetical protein
MRQINKLRVTSYELQKDNSIQIITQSCTENHRCSQRKAESRTNKQIPHFVRNDAATKRNRFLIPLRYIRNDGQTQVRGLAAATPPLPQKV